MSRESARLRSTTQRLKTKNDEGAGTLEYILLILGVTVLLGSAGAGYTSAGHKGLERLCELLGTECPAPGTDEAEDRPGSDSADPRREEKPPPSDPCVVRTDQVSINAKISVSFVDLGGGRIMTTEKLSDGTYRVTVTNTANIGATATAGEATGRIGSHDIGVVIDTTANASAAIEMSGGTEFTFDSIEEVEKFYDWANREFVKDVVNTNIPNIFNPGGITVDIGGKIVDKFTGYDYPPPEPSAVYLEGGVVIAADAKGQVIAGAEVAIEGKNVIGARIDRKNEQTTVYSRVTLDATAAGELGIVGGHASAGVETIVETTVDKNGNIIEVGWTVVASAEAGYSDLTGLLTDQPLTGAAGKGITMHASYPVTDANRVETLAFLGAMGVGGGLVGPAPTQGAAGLWILNEARNNGDITVQTLNVSKDNLLDAALALKAPAVGGLGFELGVDSSSSVSDKAWYYGNDGFVEWEACNG